MLSGVGRECYRRGPGVHKAIMCVYTLIHTYISLYTLIHSYISCNVENVMGCLWDSCSVLCKDVSGEGEVRGEKKKVGSISAKKGRTC